MGVWAEQNTRDNLFNAMQRREVFATSGPRIGARFFAGWKLAEDICSSNVAEAGYAGGVPMGGELSAGPGSGGSAGQGSPLFVATARADSGSAAAPGNRLQRLQIIKVWHDSEGRFHQRVNDLVGKADDNSILDLDNCLLEPATAGHSEICATWRDPEFASTSQAAYYVRVLENPSCRWSWRHCLAQPEGQRSAACSDENVPKSIRERAWTSPIWVRG